VADGWGERAFKVPNQLDMVTGAADARALWPHLRKPTGYWTWQKGPWDAGRTAPTAGYDSGTLGLLLPYWMARYHGLLN
jgi:hypothetical protein